ncbi:serine/threonine protein kinase [Hyalangium versicolor]|uniref:serine/threonine protein kinase n=1 Tax=Hyalangium versicolor TaxID=2861190 RepID=UPI001CCDE358|nr:serine/threonine-protein kinase [Hyalangium versicolor]
MQQLGKYQLIRKLATGGMAEVYLAKAAGPMGFEKTLVLKRILPHLAEDPQFVEMFLAEAKLAAQLNHPNIVQIFDFGEADGDYFLAMEFIDGPNLRVLLKRANAAGLALPPALCARLVAAACEGLAFAHDFQDPTTGEPLGLIHRDISPDNILVSRQGAVKVVDFGIAKAAGQSHKTQSGVIKGKLAYMPPEQVRAKPLDRRVDVYALGVVLYELLTRRKPYDATTDASLMQAILFEAHTPAVQHRPDLPESLQQILERAIHKDPEQRYPDCLALETDLEEFILSVGKPVTTHQIVQLIAQVAPSTDAPVPTPQTGSARGGSGPRPSATPSHTPAPGHSGVGTGPRSGTRPAPGSRVGSMAAPVDPAVAMNPSVPLEPSEPLEPAPEELSAKTMPLPTGELQTKTQPQESPAALPSWKRWLPAAMGAVLLAAGGGFVFWRMKTLPEPVTPPQEAVRPLQNGTTTPPPSTNKPPEPIVAKDPSGTGTPPTPDQPGSAQNTAPETSPNNPPSGTTPPDGNTKPVEVAKVEPANNPAENPEPSKPANSTSQKRPTTRPTTRPTRPAASASTAVGKGTVVFRVRPYATVILSGRNLGQTPFDPVETPAGKYTVQFINDDLKKKVTQAFELKAGETKVIKINLEE